MNTGQIVIFSILFIAIGFCYVKTIYTLDEQKPKSFIYMFGLAMLIFLLALVAVTTTLEMNDTHKQLKGKCPEYELIENVYKLKQ